MEFLSAFSGLERIAIIAAATVIGYWGFRLFASDRIPGLVFMGVACAVLIAVLITGGDHVETLSRSLQPSTIPASAPIGAPETTPEPTTSPAAAPQTIAPPQAQPMAEKLADEALAEHTGGDAQTTALGAPAAAEAEPAPDSILGGRDLDGRIISVKSENVTLEWTPPSE